MALAQALDVVTARPRRSVAKAKLTRRSTASLKTKTKGVVKVKRATKHKKKEQPTPNTINLRIDVETRSLIDQARNVLGQNRTEFMLASARVSAQEVLRSQTHFTLTDDGWAEFQEALEAPPVPTDELIHLMASNPPWEN